jgi:uncharacterized protein (DUF58 family)
MKPMADAETSDSVLRSLRPSSWLPFLAWAGLLSMQLISPDKAWSWLLVGLSALIVISYGWARMLRDRVTAERQVLGSWVVAGDQLREQFTVTNLSTLPVLWVQVKDGSAVPGYSADRVESVGPRSERSWSGTGVCQRRGVFRLGPWDLLMSDPLGFFEVKQHYSAITTIMVYPRASFLPHIELPRGRAAGRATTSERAPMETITVGGLRDYAEGDSLRRIHWPATAHHDKLMVREFDREPSGDVWLILDMDARVQAGHDAEATQEYAVILAASLAARFTREGERRAVGLLVSGQKATVLNPARGQTQLWRILRALAEAEPKPDLSFAKLLQQAGPTLGSGRTLVLITPSQDSGWVVPLLPLMARGNAPTVLLVDATTFDPPRGDEAAMNGVRSLLIQQRIPSYIMAQGFPFHPLVRIRRQRQEFKTLAGTGRVIQVQVEEEV